MVFPISVNCTYLRLWQTEKFFSFGTSIPAFHPWVSPRSFSRTLKTAGLEQRELESNIVGSDQANGPFLGTGAGAREGREGGKEFGCIISQDAHPTKSLSSVPMITLAQAISR